MTIPQMDKMLKKIAAKLGIGGDDDSQASTAAAVRPKTVSSPKPAAAAPGSIVNIPNPSPALEAAWTYNELRATGKAREAGQFYMANSDAIYKGEAEFPAYWESVLLAVFDSRDRRALAGIHFFHNAKVTADMQSDFLDTNNADRQRAYQFADDCISGKLNRTTFRSQLK